MSSFRHAREQWKIGGSIAAALVVALLGASMETAHAQPPPKPGAITNLTVGPVTLDEATYTVDATWDTATNATSYLVKLTSASGTVLDQERVTATAFSGATTQPAGSIVKVVVTPFNQRRRGRTATKSTTLPDLTAPAAEYALSPQNSPDGSVTISQTSLTDNVSGAAQITQSIDWGDSSSVSTGPGTMLSFAHTYSATPAVYHPVITVTDQAGNPSTYTLAAVVLDSTDPTGSFTVAPPTAWARWTRVTVTQLTLSDNLSAPADIARSVDWGDGRTSNWTAATTLDHRYRMAGVFTPVVTITDEAGNSATPISTSGVTVTVDAVAPRLKLSLPTNRRQSTAKWNPLRGRVRDVETGVRDVRVEAIEKRHGSWYGYRANSGRWVTAATKKDAWRRATFSTVVPTTRRWSVPLQRLRVGLLVYRASSRDNVGNRSAWKSHQQLLTRS